MTTDTRTRLRQLAQADLGAWVEVVTGSELWSIQTRVASAVSKRRARVAVPSCHASGKTWLAARLALAFYDAYTPGTPCVQCGGPCRGAKIVTTSSKAEHLRDALWSEMRLAALQIEERGIKLAGRMSQGQNLRMESSSDHFIVGHSPNHAESFQGLHSAHKLIIGDEATSLDDQMRQGITGLLSTADSRLLLIFNPTTDDNYAAQQAKSPATETIRIRAWDTPNFTGEHVPEGANLCTPEWIEELKSGGMGPGTMIWANRVEAEFWTQGADTLVTIEDYERASMAPHIEGTRALGIDLAPYGTDENVIAYRDGNALVRLDAFPAMRPDLFFQGPVADAVRAHDPDYIIWDADGVGAGVYGDVERVAAQHTARGGNVVLLPFRGAVNVGSKFFNARSAWWWSLRQKFATGALSLTLPADPKLKEQVTDIRYSITPAGDIKIETKGEMRKRGTESPDRGDAFMYAFSMLDELPHPDRIVRTPVTTVSGVKDRSEDAMWRRDLEKLRRPRSSTQRTPWDKLPPGAMAWDDL